MTQQKPRPRTPRIKQNRTDRFIFGEIHRYRDGSTWQYNMDERGLTQANAAAESGDVIAIGVGTINLPSAFTLKAGVKYVGVSRYGTILDGAEIIGKSGASLENMTISQSKNSSTNIVGVSMPVSGTLYINSCDIEITQAGSGNAYGMSSEISGADIEAWNCFIKGDSTGGDGYAGWRDTGTSASTHTYGGRLYGSTDEFNS